MLTYKITWRPLRTLYILCLAGLIFWITNPLWLPTVICLLAIVDLDISNLIKSNEKTTESIKYGPQ